MKKLKYANFIYAFISICLLILSVSCDCKNSPNNNPKTNLDDTNQDPEKPIEQAHILLSSNKKKLLPSEKIFQIIINNQADIAADLSKYRLIIKLQEDGNSGSTLSYKDANKQVHNEKKIDQVILHFINQPTLAKKDKDISIPFDIINKAGVTKITFTVTLEHIDKKDAIQTVRIIWEGLTPITDDMIQEAEKNNFDILAQKLINLKEGKRDSNVKKSKGGFNIEDFDIKSFINDIDTVPYQAVKLGNINIIKILIERGVTFIKNPLELAIKENKIEIAKLLIDQLDQVELNGGNIFGKTPIQIAIENDNTEIALLLINKLDGYTLSTKLKNKIILQELDDNYYNPTLLHLAIENDNTKIAIALIKKLDESALNIEKCIKVHKSNYNPWTHVTSLSDSTETITPLQMAIQNNNIEIANALIEKLNVKQLNKQGPNNNTALHLAAKNNQVDIAKKLINKGVDKTIRNEDNKTPFDLAKTSEMEDVLKL